MSGDYAHRIECHFSVPLRKFTTKYGNWHHSHAWILIWLFSKYIYIYYTSQSTRRLFAGCKKVEISEFSGVLPFYSLSKLFQ